MTMAAQLMATAASYSQLKTENVDGTFSYSNVIPIKCGWCCSRSLPAGVFVSCFPGLVLLLKKVTGTLTIVGRMRHRIEVNLLGITTNVV